MNRNELEAILPHRGRMLLLDSAELVTENGVQVSRAKKTIREDEFFLDGHFPGNPIVPGVILCEILAQSACVLLQGMGGENVTTGEVTTLLTGLDGVKFKRPVRPGDTLETACRITAQKSCFYFAVGEIRVAGELCLSGKFSFAVLKKKEGATD